MDKIDEVCGVLVEIRDSIEDLLDMLIPPPVDERLESAMSEAPPKRGVAEVRGGESSKGRKPLPSRAQTR